MSENKQDLLPCINELRRLFSYNPETGELNWNVSKGKARKGDSCGSVDSKGRKRVELQGKTYAAHQIAFAMHHGRWAEKQVDHINRNKLDNRIANLREASNSENSRNRSNSRNSSGFKGVSFHKRQNKFNARIMADGVMHNLGSFDSAQDAADAYDLAAIKYHGDFALLNNRRKHETT